MRNRRSHLLDPSRESILLPSPTPPSATTFFTSSTTCFLSSTTLFRSSSSFIFTYTSIVFPSSIILSPSSIIFLSSSDCSVRTETDRRRLD